MLRRLESETAEPQKESLRDSRDGQPRERTSVAVSERAQQKDCLTSVHYFFRKFSCKKVLPDPAPSIPSQRSSNTR
jgi:hypothetical protein